MAPVKPHWPQPSHPNILKVLTPENNKDYASKSISLINIPPYGLFAPLKGPLTTTVSKPTYATVQISENEHIDLNSDLLYVNHSCEPSVIFNTTTGCVIAGPNGLKAGDEVTFFYPSTEWSMAQGFHCVCGASNCCGYISGAKDMNAEQLGGRWLSEHVVKLLENQKSEEVA